MITLQMYYLVGGLVALFTVLLVSQAVYYSSKIKKVKEELTKVKNDPKQLEISATELLHDLTAHERAFVQITRIAPADIFIRSSRG